MLYLFDMDGTLISGYMDSPSKDFNDWRVLPRRTESLDLLKRDGHQIAIITNQGGVAFGYQSEDHVYQKLYAAMSMLGLLGHSVYVCYGHPSATIEKYRDPEMVARRKPSGAMIRMAIRDFPEAAADGVLMIGDRPEDEAAAIDAGVPFQWASEFFGDAP